MSELKAVILKPDFGIEDVLAPDAKVLFENVFSTRHIGRVMDFFIHESRPFFNAAPAGARDAIEHRFRHIFEMLVFNAWTNYRDSKVAKVVEIEVGYDGQKLAVAVTHSCAFDLTEFMPGSDPQSENAKRVRQMLQQIQVYSDGLIVRHGTRSGRMQVVAMLSLDGTPSNTCEYVSIAGPEAIRAVSGLANSSDQILPLERGDVENFIKDENTERQESREEKQGLNAVQEAAEGQSVEDFLNSEAKSTRVTADLTVEGQSKVKDIGDGLYRVKGSNAGDVDKTEFRVRGGGGEADEELIKVKGGSGESASPDMLVIGGAEGGDPMEGLFLSPEDEAEVQAAEEQVAEADQELAQIDAKAVALGDKTAIAKKKAALQKKAAAVTAAKAKKEAVKKKVAKKKAVAAAEGDDKFVIKGVTSSIDGESMVVSGSDGGEDTETIVVGGSGEDEVDDFIEVEEEVTQITNDGQVQKVKKKVRKKRAEFDESMKLDTEIAKDVEENVVTLSDEIRSEIVDVAPEFSKEKYDALFMKATRTIRENYKATMDHAINVQKIQQEAQIKLYKEQLQSMSDKIEELKGQLGIQEEEKESKVDFQGEEEKKKDIVDTKEFDKIATSAMKQIETSGEMPGHVKEWAKTLLNQVLKERGEFNRRVREFQSTERKVEHQFRTQETMLKEQLRMREEQIRQKEFTVQKTRESLGNALTALEKLKAAQKDTQGGGDLTQRLYTAEKMLTVAKENSVRSQDRADDMQQKLMSETARVNALNKEVMIKQRQLVDFQKKYEAALSNAIRASNTEGMVPQKIVDGMKNQLKALQDKLATTSAQLSKANSLATMSGVKGPSGGADQELKHKLESTNRLFKATKDEADKMRRRFDELKMSETKMKVEIAKLQAQLKLANKKS